MPHYIARGPGIDYGSKSLPELMRLVTTTIRTRASLQMSADAVVTQGGRLIASCYGVLRRGYPKDRGVARCEFTPTGKAKMRKRRR